MIKFMIKCMDYLICNKGLDVEYYNLFKIKPIGSIHAVAFRYPFIEFIDFTYGCGISSREINIYRYLILNILLIIKNFNKINKRNIQYTNNYRVYETEIFLEERINNLIPKT